MTQSKPRGLSRLLSLVLIGATSTLPAVAQGPNLEALWAELGLRDADRADRAAWVLALMPDKTVPFLKSRLQPLTGDREHIAKLVGDLGSDTLRVRQSAYEELEKLS